MVSLPFGGCGEGVSVPQVQGGRVGGHGGQVQMGQEQGGQAEDQENHYIHHCTRHCGIYTQVYM